MINRFFLYFFTVLNLRLTQVWFQVVYRVIPFRPKAKLSNVRLTNCKEISWQSYIVPGTNDGISFTFFNKAGSVTDKWSEPNYEKLWLYNLHYLNDVGLNSGQLSLTSLEQLIIRWIEGNPPNKGVGWESYPISIRIVNILKFLSSNRMGSPPDVVMNSLAIQAGCLMSRLEYHILANHLLANAKALVFAGILLEGKDVIAWREKGLEILDQQLIEQFKQDGGHYELSPMYHAILIWDVCDLICLAQSSNSKALLCRVDNWLAIVEAGIIWMQAMVHPDREISFFNDSAFSIGPTLDQLETYANNLGIVICEPQRETEEFWSHKLLQDTGFVCVFDGSLKHKAILDIGQIGCSYQPGHAHADTLSFELSLFGQRLFVNSGTSTYEDNSLRHYQRGTAAHNTVQVDEKNSSEVWSGFRVASRARPGPIEISSSPECLVVNGYYTSYFSVLRGPKVSRKWQFLPASVRIEDSINGNFKHAVARLHCSPDVCVESVNGQLLLNMADGKIIFLTSKNASKIIVKEGFWYPRFGEAVANKRIELEFEGDSLSVELSWELE